MFDLSTATKTQLVEIVRQVLTRSRGRRSQPARRSSVSSTSNSTCLVVAFLDRAEYEMNDDGRLVPVGARSCRTEAGLAEAVETGRCRSRAGDTERGRCRHRQATKPPTKSSGTEPAEPAEPAPPGSADARLHASGLMRSLQFWSPLFQVSGGSKAMVRRQLFRTGMSVAEFPQQLPTSGVAALCAKPTVRRGLISVGTADLSNSEAIPTRRFQTGRSWRRLPECPREQTDGWPSSR